MLPNGSRSVIALISTLDRLDLILYDNDNDNIRNSEYLMWDFASTSAPTGNTLEDIDAKLYPDKVYRAREEERELQALFGRIKTSNRTTR